MTDIIDLKAVRTERMLLAAIGAAQQEIGAELDPQTIRAALDPQAIRASLALTDELLEVIRRHGLAPGDAFWALEKVFIGAVAQLPAYCREPVVRGWADAAGYQLNAANELAAERPD